MADPVVSENLLQNGSFEESGQPTLAAWRFGNPDLASTVQPAAPGQGAWSLRLDADWAPTLGYAYASVPSARPGDRLKLSAYVRALAPDGGGVIKIVTGRAPWSRENVEYGAGTASTTWTPLSVDAVASDDPADSVWVVLSSPHTEVTARSGLFDGVTLVRLAR
jgi:hypothetical protein